MMRWLPLSFGAVCLLLVARPAQAYPQFVFKGYGDCNSCHHSPTGGGLPNRWGLDSLTPSFGGSLDWGNQDLTYHPAEPASLKVDLGADLRLMPLLSVDADAAAPAFIPMLTELGGALALGRWMAYGTVTGRKLYGDGPPFAAFSREHWLKFQPSTGLDLRVGRMVLPFGTRIPDHTQYTREDFEQDKYDQSYGVELDLHARGWSLSVNAFAGDLTHRPTERQERGLVLTPSIDLGERANLGISLLGATSTARTRLAGSLFGRTALGASLYLLAELAAQEFAAKEGDDKLFTLAEYLRVGWFAKPSLDVYVEGGHRTFVQGEGLSKARVALGLNWQVLRWFEFAPQLEAEARTQLPARFIAMAQLHAVY
ncbi:MAG TPA: hypothetical protein VFS67_37345 [Polyangiaceae bacterium]|nr:hypothetical protein [Polyangiaceae bacterium]